MAALIVSLVAFYFFHSLLAAENVKAWAHRNLGLQRWYRAVYVIITLLLLTWVVASFLSIEAHPLIMFPIGLRILGILLLVIGILLQLLSVMRFGFLGFIGIVPERSGELVRSGLHGKVRHPIYSGFIIMAFGWLLLAPTLPVIVTVLVSFLYLPAGIHLEEKKLIARFGDAYRRYRSEVPAIVPFKW